MFFEKHGSLNALIFLIWHVTSGRIFCHMFVYSHVYSTFNFTKTGHNFCIILMIPEPCSTHQYLNFDQTFLIDSTPVSFTMQWLQAHIELNFIFKDVSLMVAYLAVGSNKQTYQTKIAIIIYLSSPLSFPHYLVHLSFISRSSQQSNYI